MDRDEVAKWKEFHKRFRLSMAVYENDMSTIHSNRCDEKTHKCKLCMAKAKLVVLTEEVRKLVEKM